MGFGKAAFLCYLSNKIVQSHKKSLVYCIHSKKEKFRTHVKAMYNLKKIEVHKRLDKTQLLQMRIMPFGYDLLMLDKLNG